MNLNYYKLTPEIAFSKKFDTDLEPESVQISLSINRKSAMGFGLFLSNEPIISEDDDRRILNILHENTIEPTAMTQSIVFYRNPDNGQYLLMDSARNPHTSIGLESMCELEGYSILKNRDLKFLNGHDFEVLVLENPSKSALFEGKQVHIMRNPMPFEPVMPISKIYDPFWLNRISSIASNDEFLYVTPFGFSI